MTDPATPASAPAAVTLLPSDRFFIRTVPLVAGTEAGAQIALALESMAPFPVDQLYYGFVPSSAGDSALVYASYRKRFPANEITDWPQAEAVFPAFLVLLADAPKQPCIRLWTEPLGLTAAAWDGKGSLPVAVLARETEGPTEAAERLALVEEIRTRTGLRDAVVKEFSGAATGRHSAARENFALVLGTGASALTLDLSRAQADQADVRDKGFLAGERTALRRDLLLWRTFLGCLIGLAALLFLEIGVLGGDFWLKGVKAKLKEHTGEVEKIETAQRLSTRIEELTERKLLPFEMLALANENRPASIQFSRALSTGLFSMEIQAQTASAADVGQYEAVLRASPNIETVETRDLRSRDGFTNFTLTVTFKPAALAVGGGS